MALRKTMPIAELRDRNEASQAKADTTRQKGGTPTQPKHKKG